MLAFADPGFVESVLSEPLIAHTPDTVIDPEKIRAELAQIRRTGLAQSIGGFEAEVHSHAVPVFGPDRAPLGALAVAAPVSRITDDSKRVIAAELSRLGRELTDRIGGIAPADFPADFETGTTP